LPARESHPVAAFLQRGAGQASRHKREISGFAHELARVYRQARTGELEGNETRTLVAALRELRATLESADLEKRLQSIELRLGMRT